MTVAVEFRNVDIIFGDKTEAAYRRGDLFEKRKALMAAWADYLDRLREPISGKNVLPLRRP